MNAAITRTTIGIATALGATVGASAQLAYNGYFRFLGDSPSAAEPDWSDNAQGLAHDQNNWFVTNNQGELWKIPLSHSLCCNEADDAGVSVVHIEDIPALAGYQQFKDPVGHLHGGNWYLFVPMSGDGVPTAVAVFRADSLQFVDHQTFVNENGTPVGGYISPSWCATNASEHLVLPYQFSGGASNGVIEYWIDWIALTSANPGLTASFLRTIPLLDENGAPLYFENPQGGEFSLDGKLLYTVTGYLDDTDEEMASEGIHAFDTTTWRRVGHSTNGSGLFNYAWDPGDLTAEEPQGLTMWDLDGSGTPGLGGQMHVIMLDNDVGPDDIYLKHYTNRIWVNGASPFGNGTLAFPFHMVGEAANLSWNGCEVRIGAGLYDEGVTFNRRVKLIADGGTVRIGG